MEARLLNYLDSLLEWFDVCIPAVFVDSIGFLFVECSVTERKDFCVQLRL